jgi:exopolyphosphatase/guanosine-5'-triphosphate,3'-diphosphate pyrophosphatase
MKAYPVRSRADAERALALARETLRPFTDQLKRFPPALRLVGLGGSCTTLAAMEMGREAHGEAVEGRYVTRDQAEKWLKALAEMPLEERRRVPGLPPARAEHMPHGLCILISALDACGFPGLTVSGKTNLDGYLSRLSE